MTALVWIIHLSPVVRETEDQFGRFGIGCALQMGQKPVIVRMALLSYDSMLHDILRGTSSIRRWARPGLSVKSQATDSPRVLGRSGKPMPSGGFILAVDRRRNDVSPH